MLWLAHPGVRSLLQTLTTKTAAECKKRGFLPGYIKRQAGAWTWSGNGALQLGNSCSRCRCCQYRPSIHSSITGTQLHVKSKPSSSWWYALIPFQHSSYIHTPECKISFVAFNLLHIASSLLVAFNTTIVGSRKHKMIKLFVRQQSAD